MNSGILYLYFNSFQQIDEEEYGGAWELTKEGFLTSFAGFLVNKTNAARIAELMVKIFNFCKQKHALKLSKYVEPITKYMFKPISIYRVQTLGNTSLIKTLVLHKMKDSILIFFILNEKICKFS